MTTLKFVSGFLVLIAFALISFASQADISVNCTPDQVGQSDVGTINSRIFIHCNPAAKDGSTAVAYFAVPTSGNDDQANTATKLMEIGKSAMVLGKTVNVSFTSGDPSGSSYGCDPSNCRPPHAFYLAGTGPIPVLPTANITSNKTFVNCVTNPISAFSLGSCSCGSGTQISKVMVSGSSCNVTSETGSCGVSGWYTTYSGEHNSGSCCVCSPAAPATPIP